MGGQKSSLLLFPHQLYPLKDLPDVDTVIVAEDPLSFGLDSEYRRRLHKQKLIHMRASMRRYVEEVLWPAGVKVEYVELDPLLQVSDLLRKVHHSDQLIIFDPSNEILTTRLLQARRDLGDAAPAIEFLPSPNFYLKEQEIRQYFTQRHQHQFAEFYQWQRERFNILIEDYKPVGGSWMLDNKQTAVSQPLPSFPVFGDNQWVAEASEYVGKHFSDNPGSSDCIWPTSHAEAARWLADFAQHRLDAYGPHSDAINSEAPWLYHSALSTSLNIGLLNPEQVVDAAISRHHERPVSLASLELFVRRILGQREFIRGIAVVGGPELRQANPLQARRRLTQAWYDGTTGIPIFDDVVKKLLTRGYVHDSERLHVAATLMTLCEITPSDIHQWFQELFVDSQDWSLTPHIYALGQFADETTLEGGPYICTSKMLMDKSDYGRGEWANVWDGLYWKFIERHRAVLRTKPGMRSVVQRLDRLDPDQKRIMYYRADDFLQSHTQ